MSKQELKKELIQLILVIIVLSIFLAWRFRPVAYEEIKIEQGDNLITLAEQYKGSLSTDYWVAIVKTENAIYDDIIMAGQTLRIPESKPKRQLASDQ
ncbi:cell division suppressor protein YneA [Metalysinibacillus jejuensis]|uniref:cell division suppressor protein YneA n=1 Tax=Metalysinibacillus jejuensis TaxID=914327 RepID=UPI000D3730DC|nr:hypothetical protein [Metalysinibacillus jejuensis]